MNVYLMEAKWVATGKTAQAVLKCSERELRATIKRELQNKAVGGIRVWAKPVAHHAGATWDAPTFKTTSKLVYSQLLDYMPMRRSDKKFMLMQFLRRNAGYQTLHKASLIDAEVLAYHKLIEVHPEDATMYKLTDRGEEYLTVKNWWSPKKFRSKPSRKILRTRLDNFRQQESTI